MLNLTNMVDQQQATHSLSTSTLQVFVDEQLRVARMWVL